MPKIMFFIQNVSLITLGFLIKATSLSLEGGTARSRMQMQGLVDLCKDKAQHDGLCDLSKSISFYGEAMMLSRVALATSVIALLTLLLNQKMKLYQSRWNAVFIVASLALGWFCFFSA
jgi:hypothetical protein